MGENGNQTFMEKVKSVIQKISEKINPKKKVIFGIGGALVVIAGVGTVWLLNRNPNDKNMPDMSMFSISGNSLMESYVMASGTTSLGYTMDEFEPDYIETELYIEEVYLSSSDEVDAGTAVFKVSDESILEAREELEEKEVEANLAYRAGVVSYEQSKINAKYTYDAALLEGQHAEAVYQNALKTADKKVQEARDKVTETEENIEKYKSAFADYYYEYNVDKYKERYEKNKSVYDSFLAEWGFDDKEVSGGGGMESQGENQSGNSQPPSQNESEGENSQLPSQNGSEGENSQIPSQNGSEDGNSQSTIQNGSGNGDGMEEGSGSDQSLSQSEREAGNGEDDENGDDDEGGDDENGEDDGNGDDDEIDTSAISQVLSLFSDSDRTLARITSSKTLADGTSLVSVADTQNEDYTRRLKILQQMKTNVQNSEKYYLNAWNAYEAAATEVNSQVSKLEIQIDALRADLAEAETDYQLEVLEAETTYKKSVAQLELAKSDYNAAIQKAEDELEALEDDKTEAQENMEEFEALLGDGYFYTQNAGTVMMVGVRKDSNLQGGGMVVAYRNAQDISVTVYVSQEDINKLRVGDAAQVMVEDYGTYEGKITYLNPISGSDTRTNITYEVLVEVQGDNVGNLKENLTANVIFTTGDNGQ